MVLLAVVMVVVVWQSGVGCRMVQLLLVGVKGKSRPRVMMPMAVRLPSSVDNHPATARFDPKLLDC